MNIEDLNYLHSLGVYDPWASAPKPRRFHKCKTLFGGIVGGRFVERCACGGMKVSGFGGWTQRNSRK